MSSITHEPLCKTRYCPAPRDPDWHACLRCESPYIEHHHVNGRGGMGGSKRLREDSSAVVALCQKHHDEVSLNKLTDFIRDVPGQGRIYFAVDIRGTVVFERALSDGGEDSEVGAGGIGGRAKVGSSPPSPSALGAPQEDGVSVGAAPSSEQVDGEIAYERTRMLEGDPSGSAGRDSTVSPHLSWERWCEMGQAVRLLVHEMPWRFGDWANLGQEHFGEPAWQEISHGFDKRDWDKVRNWMWVAASYKPAERVEGVSWSHHRQALVLEPQARRRLLLRAKDEGLTRDEMRDLIAATSVTKKRERCWRLEELRELAAGKHQEWRQKQGLGGHGEIRTFLDWLAEREEADMQREND